MRKTLATSTIAFLTVITCHAQVQSRTQEGGFFIRPAYTRAEFVKGGSISGGLNGGTVAAGLFSNGVHEFSLETGYLGGLATGPLDDGSTYTGTANLAPLPWINYRYYIPLGSDKFRFHIGPTIGATYLKLDVDGVGSDSCFLFTYGGGGGLTLNLTEKLVLDANYRYLMHTDASMFGGTVTTPATHFISAGLSYTF